MILYVNQGSKCLRYKGGEELKDQVDAAQDLHHLTNGEKVGGGRRYMRLDIFCVRDTKVMRRPICG